MKKISILLLVITLCACGNKKEASLQPESNNIMPVIIEEIPSVTEENLVDGTTSPTAHPNDASFNGTLIIPPQKMATVTLTLGGIIKSISLLPGQYIRQGTVLATLENPEFIELQQLWLESSAQLEYLETEYKRQQTLSAEQAASQKKYQQSKAEYLSMKSRAEASSAQLLLLGVTTEQLEKNGIQPLLHIKAPISGYLSSVDMNIGKYMNPGETLCEIIDKNQTMLKLTAYEKDLTGIQPHRAVEFRVNGMGNKIFRGTVLSIGQKVDEMSRSIDVYVKIEDGHADFRPGMYATARIKK